MIEEAVQEEVEEEEKQEKKGGIYSSSSDDSSDDDTPMNTTPPPSRPNISMQHTSSSQYGFSAYDPFSSGGSNLKKATSSSSEGYGGSSNSYGGTGGFNSTGGYSGSGGYGNTSVSSSNYTSSYKNDTYNTKSLKDEKSTSEYILLFIENQIMKIVKMINQN